ncbi:hypothetical protein [Methylobacterium sp. WL6]|uniref:hypothetical protein n=1 Tax=Methylobacterium sp. WL6 TaxID=2603901 RepID=UPI0011CB2B89|nr:hypothetical protein [Methylobacterium sp. WL6]TXN66326.1 hypothetical protein FV230_15665 [Methylobacterium sp. WL6]
MWRIFVPLRYLAIKHDGKWKFDIFVSLILCACFCWPLFIEGFRNDAIDKFDILGKSTGFLGTLAGFYIAALAAVATFGRPEMDEPMAGPVRLRHRRAAEMHVEELSRRRFLSFLFGYLAFAALALAFIGSMYIVVDKYLLINFQSYKSYIFSVFWIIYTFVSGNIIANSLLGLFYLTDRMHRPNYGINWSNPGPDAAE